MAAQSPSPISGAAGRYARALYAYADEAGQLAAIVPNMERFAALIDSEPSLLRAMKSPLVGAARVHPVLIDLIRAHALGDAAHRLIEIVIANRRLPMLRDILGAFAALVAEKRGIITAEVTTAHPLTDTEENSLRARLIELGHGSVRIERHVDPSLLGGLVLRIGARLYDSSLKSRLQRLQYAMKGAA